MDEISLRSGMKDTAKLIAELHAAGLSNEKIGYLLTQHGLSEAISERTVRRWAMRNTEPRISEYNALRSLHASAIGIPEADKNADRSPAES